MVYITFRHVLPEKYFFLIKYCKETLCNIIYNSKVCNHFFSVMNTILWRMEDRVCIECEGYNNVMDSCDMVLFFPYCLYMMLLNDAVPSSMCL